jgi:diacylglycerol kinase (ATP)
VVFAAGGDGTIHQVVQALAGTDSTLGIIPLGTSNDLARRVGIPRGVAGLGAVLQRPQIARLDLIKFGRVRIVTVGGFGLPAHVADVCNRVKSRSLLTPAVRSLGSGIYPVVAGSRILRRGAETSTYTFRSNRGPATAVRASAVIVGVVACFGGGLRLARDGEVRAGTFAALFVTATTRFGLFSALWRMKTGRQIEGLATSHSGLTHLTVRTRDLVGTFGDGEWLGLMHRTEIKLEPQSLHVLLPGHLHSDYTVLSAVREAV